MFGFNGLVSLPVTGHVQQLMLDARWYVQIEVRRKEGRVACKALQACSTAFSMPRFGPIGLAPAATFFEPSRMIACASTVAVVVPSPAISEVLLATSLTMRAPRFSTGSGTSISFATVTPSLVLVGEPNFLSRTTLRPFGPNVTFTASASLLTPRVNA